VADVDGALVQQVLDIAERKGKANVHHDRQADDLRAAVKGRVFVMNKGCETTLPASRRFILTMPAIELCLTFGMIFKQPLRQAEGLMRSIAGLLGVEIAVPHYTTLSRRGNGLSLSDRAISKNSKPVLDSTGLRIFGEGALLAQAAPWPRSCQWPDRLLQFDHR
jgi:hypothetical protein